MAKKPDGLSKPAAKSKPRVRQNGTATPGGGNPPKRDPKPKPRKK